MIRRPPRSTRVRSSAASDVYKRQLCSTDLVYYASGRLGVPGAMWTASHNPAQYNGLKLCRAGAEPVSLDTGLAAIRDRAQSGNFPPSAEEGRHSRRDLIGEYADHMRGFVDVG